MEGLVYYVYYVLSVCIFFICYFFINAASKMPEPYFFILYTHYKKHDKYLTYIVFWLNWTY